jgi:hypothetical protein
MVSVVKVVITWSVKLQIIKLLKSISHAGSALHVCMRVNDIPVALPHPVSYSE